MRSTVIRLLYSAIGILTIVLPSCMVSGPSEPSSKPVDESAAYSYQGMSVSAVTDAINEIGEQLGTCKSSRCEEQVLDRYSLLIARARQLDEEQATSPDGK